jgi:tetratricopeptide (TPR) repeat protein
LISRTRKPRAGFSRKRADLQTPEARAKREEILGPNPWGGYDHNRLGCEFLRRDALDLALSEMERAVAINPWEPTFKVNLFHAYLRKGRVEEAAKTLDEALEQEPRLAAGWFAYALLYEKLSRREDAVRCYRKCLACAPGEAVRKQAYENLGRLMAEGKTRKRQPE